MRDYLFDSATMGAAKEVTVQWMAHRTRDARVFGCHSFEWRVAICRLKSPNLSAGAISLMALACCLNLSFRVLCEASGERRPRRMLSSHDRQRVS